MKILLLLISLFFNFSFGSLYYETSSYTYTDLSYTNCLTKKRDYSKNVYTPKPCSNCSDAHIIKTPTSCVSDSSGNYSFTLNSIYYYTIYDDIDTPNTNLGNNYLYLDGNVLHAQPIDNGFYDDDGDISCYDGYSYSNINGECNDDYSYINPDTNEFCGSKANALRIIENVCNGGTVNSWENSPDSSGCYNYVTTNCNNGTDEIIAGVYITKEFTTNSTNDSLHVDTYTGTDYTATYDSTNDNTTITRNSDSLSFIYNGKIDSVSNISSIFDSLENSTTDTSDTSTSSSGRVATSSTTGQNNTSQNSDLTSIDTDLNAITSVIEELRNNQILDNTALNESLTTGNELTSSTNTAINNLNTNVTTQLNGISKKFDSLGNNINDVKNSVNNTTSAINNLNNSLTGPTDTATNQKLSDIEDNENTIIDGLNNLTNGITDINNKFDETMLILNNGFNTDYITSLTTNEKTCPLSFEAFGKSVSVDICYHLIPFSSAISLIITLLMLYSSIMFVLWGVKP